MKKLFAFVFILAMLGMTLEAAAQRSRTERPESSFGNQLWYGGNFILGYASNSFSSEFQIGISPMVGYKFTELLSIGPRVGFVYSFFKTRLGNGRIEKAQPIDWAIGFFGRHKITHTLFAHLEYEFENEARVFVNFDQLEIARRERNNLYLGGGYNSGSDRIGYEILILYNLNEPQNTVENPFSIRFGFTYNF
ncbi:MAG: hypothetical protein R3350_05345 [Saprospiraceae bacterium]|nr:hypothetical protein [Saprospiraceae bacterium]